MSKTKKPYDFNIDKLLLFLQGHIKNLSNYSMKTKENFKIIINEVEKKNVEQTKFLLEKMKEIEKKLELYSKKYKEKEESEAKKDKDIEFMKKEITIHKLKIDRLEEEKEKYTKKIIELEVSNGRIDLENEDLKTKNTKLDQMCNKLKQKLENLEKENNNNFKLLKDNFDKMDKSLNGIKNRDNYKSIIYILLINNGFNFKEIGGKVYFLINKDLKNRKIKSILCDAYAFYSCSRALAHEGYQEKIMEKLFPESEFSQKIDDNLIKEMRELINKYEDLKFLDEKEKEKKIKEIDEDIEQLTKRIKSLKL